MVLENYGAMPISQKENSTADLQDQKIKQISKQ
jgi:hypothetical protein